MNFDPNDPRWSALVLDPDSLSADERRELTALAETNATCGRFVNDLRASAGELEQQLRKEMVTPAQWQEMEAAVKQELAQKSLVEKPVKIANSSSARRWIAAIAALLLVGVTISVIYATRVSLHRDRRVSDVKWGPAISAAQQLKRDKYADVRGEVLTQPVEELQDRLEMLQAELESKNLSGPSANHGNASGGDRGRPGDLLDLAEAERPGFLDTVEENRQVLEGKIRQESPALSPPAIAGSEYAVSPDGRKHYYSESKGKADLLASAAGQGLTGRNTAPAKKPAPFVDDDAKSASGGAAHDGTHGMEFGFTINGGKPEARPLASTAAGESKPTGQPRSNLSVAQEQPLNEGKAEPQQQLASGIPREEGETRYRRDQRHWHIEQPQGNGEVYPTLVENPFIKAAGGDALSTFSIDVDTASYANVRRFLTQNMLPPAGAVRVEELINYFRYDYAPPTGEHPFAVHVETAACPWESKHRLARIALKGKVIDEDKRPASNLVFLLDVSGSMNEPNKLPLVKQSLRMLVERLTENDRVAITVYAGNSGLVLDSTTGDKKDLILTAIDSLAPGGSTNGEAGIKLAYQQAVKGFIKGGTNRVILCTDGDFNVGVSNDTELVNLITEQTRTGVFLSVLGFGMGNYKDAKMMQLSDKGNGNYAYIDTAREGRKVLVEQMSGTLITIAKDVKIQIEFNPQKVAAYRLIGYEKRMLKTEDFKDDTKDAGEIGAGHTVTALYELVPVDGTVPSAVDPLIFQPNKAVPAAEQPAGPKDDRSFVVKLRYKKPDGDTSTEFRTDGKDDGKTFSAATKDFQFAAAAASFGMILRNSEFKGGGNLAAVAEIAASAKGADEGGYRAEFVDLVNAARRIQPGK